MEFLCWTPWAQKEADDKRREEQKEALKKKQLEDFLVGPNPRTLRVDSIGTCPFCQYEGPGPGHACSVWDALHEPTKSSK